VYVVYRCADNWDDFESYIAAPTLPQALSFELAAGPSFFTVTFDGADGLAILKHSAAT
jgi:hypothetical protein